MVDFSFTDDDKVWTALMRLVKEDPLHVAVGFIDDGGDQTVLKKALMNEFGTRNIPPRPFFAQAYENNYDAMEELAGKLAQQVLEQKITKREALDKLGLWFSSKLKVEIRSGDFEPNAPSTISQKGSSKPLIDSGQMANAPTWQVRKGE